MIVCGYLLGLGFFGNAFENKSFQPLLLIDRATRVLGCAAASHARDGMACRRQKDVQSNGSNSAMHSWSWGLGKIHCKRTVASFLLIEAAVYGW